MLNMPRLARSIFAIAALFPLFVLSIGQQQTVGQQHAARKPVMDAKTRLEWHAQHELMKRETPLTSRWRHIGPMIMSGRVTDLAVPQDKPFTFYVATASGGVWKTENEGTTWAPIFDDAPSASVGAIAVDPSKTETVWVGLGEANIFRSSMSGTGIYRSDDGGTNWQHLGLADTHHIARIIVHPDDSDTVYVAASGHEYTENAERGVFKTSDGGKSWKKVLYEDEMTGAIDLVIDPENPNVLYASMWHRIRRPWSDPLPGPGGGVYKSVDGGDSWERLDKGLPPVGKAGRIGLAIAASNPNTVYALIDNHEIARAARPGELDSYGRPKSDVIKGAEVYRSDDSGQSWNKVSQSENMERLFSTYGWVFGQIRVDPNDSETTYIMGVPLMRSTDGGKTYEAVRYAGLHGDHHAMWINPENSRHIINGNDGGVNISYDGGQTWKNIENLPVVQFYNVAVDLAEPFNVYGSIQDNNSWRGPSNHRPERDPGNDWVRIPGGEASYIAIDPNNQNIMYSESFYGRIMRTDFDLERAGRTQSITPQAAEGEPALRGQWLAPFIISPHNSDTIYHGMQYVFKSTNRGDSWSKISPDLTYDTDDKRGNISYQTISTISESPVKAGVIYVGTDDGRVHVTRDDGKSWQEILAGVPDDVWVSRVVASKYDEGTVYMTKNGKRDNDFQVYVYRSSDFGQTWVDIGKGIPGGPVNVITEDPRHQNLLYVGTDLGVYVSLDSGGSWQVLGARLPNTFVHDLVVHPRDNTAVIATHGRGMFTLDLESLYRRVEK